MKVTLSTHLPGHRQQIVGGRTLLLWRLLHETNDLLDLLPILTGLSLSFRR